jgi:hypothetical protein
MESSLVIELKIACVDIGYFIGLTPAGNSQFNLGKSWDEFKSEMKQGTWRTSTRHSSFIIDVKTTYLIQHGWKNCKYQSSFILSSAASYLCLETFLYRTW